MRTLFVLLIFCLALLMTACGSQAVAPAAPVQPSPTATARGSCSLGRDFADDEQAIRGVLNAEGEMVVAQDIARLMALWADESHVTDAKNTPDDREDDQSWRGKDAIRHRYVRTVFPGAPAATQPADLEITVEPGRAVVVATTHIGAEISPAGDRWELVSLDGCWYLAGLTYNLEPNP